MFDKWKQIYIFNKNSWFNYQDLYEMVSEKFKDSYGFFVEVGVWQGASLSYLMLKNPNKAVFGIDTFLGDPLNSNEQEFIKKGKLDLKRLTVKNLESLGLAPNLIVRDSVEASKWFLDSGCDFVFIDAGHSEEQVIKDIDAWTPKVRRGGIIAGHDYDAPGVRKAVLSKFSDVNETKSNCWWVEF